MGGGTEAFPDLGRHCQLSDCHQLDFLPFTCHACHKVFCVEHRSCKSHECPKADFNSRKVLVCEICSVSIETTGCKNEDDKAILQKHEKSGDCDPKKKKKPTCPVKRCKGILTFSNTSTCKTFARFKFASSTGFLLITPVNGILHHHSRWLRISRKPISF
ncbi:zinc finger AN1 domain-containing stress-associated protein 12 [Capsicum galapagoense]